MISQYRYDGLRRRTRAVQSYADQGEDPSAWVWNNGWKKSDGTTPIAHGYDNDQNIIVLVVYNITGRKISQRDPLGHETLFQYDLLNRRKSLTNPLLNTWQTAYADLVTGGTQTVLTDPNSVDTTRTFDRLGRLLSITYGDPTDTRDVTMAYDASGNRAAMSEYSGVDFTGRVRETQYTYDARHRVTSVGFDNDGDGVANETVRYQYDAAGRRTRLTLPGDLDITYIYDARGRLVSLADWDGQISQFGYDAVGRPAATLHSNGLSSRYDYDAAGRLRQVRHHERNQILARFLYDVDQRGNRTQAVEQIATARSVVSTIGISNPAVSYYRGAWSTVSDFKVTSDWWAGMTVAFTGQEAAITVGVGEDHGLFDIYVDGSLWESFDDYAISPGERVIHLYLNTDGDHLLDIRNRHEQHRNSTGYALRFKQLEVLDTTYDTKTIVYAYDHLSRLLSADYTGVTPTRHYAYEYDLAGNRTQEAVTIDGNQTTTVRGYNEANQINDQGFTYDANGNLLSDGTNTYNWNRANRLTGMGSLTYVYDGAGNRISQNNGVDVTQYLLDLQPGLVKVLAAGTGSTTTHFIHGPQGIFAQEQAGEWTWAVSDGLGSVRSILDSTLGVDSTQSYAPYGEPLESGFGSPFTFTGELLDANDLLYLRARYYSPALGVFTALDPVENGNRYQYVGANPVNDAVGELMGMNRYAYVNGNPVNLTDPSGMFAEKLGRWDPCQRQQQECSCDCCRGSWLRWFCRNIAGSMCCECPDSEAPIPTIVPTLGAVTATPWPTATQTTTPIPAATATSTAVPTATPGTCPANSLFGCYPGTTTPIKAAWIPHVHDLPAADFVPEKSGASAANLNWEANFPQALRTVHAVAGGTVITNLHGYNDGNYRVRTDQTIEVLGRTYNVCYEYLHLEPIPDSPSYGSIISAGQPLGAIEPYQEDLNLDYDANLGPSHVHIAIWPCESNDDQMRPAAGQYRLDPLSILSFTDGVS